ncbi:MAG TPA: histidine kinase [Vicinamibacteria bacterium]
MALILAEGRRLATYGLASLTLAAATTALLARGPQAFPLAPAALLAVPLAFAGLGLLVPVRFVCRTVPVGPPFTQALALHALGAVLSAFAWAYLGAVLARFLSPSFPEAGLPARYEHHVPVVLAGGALLYLLSASLQYTRLAQEATRRAEEASLELRVLARDAELRALKAQVHPHFLFNSLNSISALTASDPPRAREMCILLSEFFRQSLAQSDRPSVTLDEELQVARTYLAIEGLRLGARLVVQEAVDAAARACRLPPLLLQPLVENAIRHGIATRAEGGVLRLEVRTDGQSLRVLVENPFDPEAPARPGVGLGLSNVRERLRARYGEGAHLNAERGADRFRVTLFLPAGEDA